MSYVSLYRKYRSQTFSDLIGQEHVVRVLQNGISSGRIAHSYLFTGPRGTGKTSTARLLAKALCCENGPTPEPDNTCPICQGITLGNCIDVNEMDAASESGVDQIRETIVEAVEYQPMMCRYKVFIIDEVHDLSAKAFDALLKTIEEPPPHIIFILATTEYNKVPSTIRSRCQKHEFHRATLQDLVSRMEFVLAGEGITAEPAAVAAIARMADGGFRDALSLLEQAILTAEGHITLEQVYGQLGLVSEDAVDGLLVAMRESKVPEIMDRLAEIARQGRDPRAILESMMFRLADLTRAAYQVEQPGTDATQEAALHETALRIGRETVLRLRGEIAQIHRSIRDVSLPRLWLEAELVRLATPLTVISADGPRAPSQEPRTPSPEPRATTPEAQAPNNGPRTTTHEPAPSAPKLQPSGDPDFDRANAAWLETKTALGQNSRLIREHLEKVYPVARSGAAIEVLVERQSDLDWILENPKKPNVAILKLMRERLGAEIEIKYVLKRQENGSEPEVNTVELPLEGQALEKLMKQIFNADST